MKKLLSVTLCCMLLLALLAATPVLAITAVRSAQNLEVNGQAINCEKYNVDGINYYKLRDIAYALNGTESQFGVAWDAGNQAVVITTGMPYEPVGGELAIGPDQSATAAYSQQKFLINGEVRQLSVVNIGGTNYLRIRDIAEAAGFQIDYDAGKDAVCINTCVTVASGVFGEGDGLTWELDGAGILTISGSGAIPSYGKGGQPWEDYSSKIVAVSIGSGITELGRFALTACYNCNSITVDPANPNLKDVDGVVFSKDGATLLQYPVGRAGDYAVPTSTSAIAGSAFQGSLKLTGLTLPSGLQSIGSMAFYNCPGLPEIVIPASVTQIGIRAFVGARSIVVDANNPTYKSTDGILFTKDGATLISYPSKRNETAFQVPAGVRIIYSGAFESSTSLEHVTLPESVQLIQGSAFAFCSALTDVYYCGTQAQWEEIQIMNGNEALAGATLHFSEMISVKPSDPEVGTAWITKAAYLGDTLTMTAEENVSAPVFLAAYDKTSGQMVGVVASVCVNGIYTLPVGADPDRYDWKLMFVDADAFAPLTCVYHLEFPA